MDADAPQSPPEPFIIDDAVAEENLESAPREPDASRPLALRLRREAMQRDSLRRSRSWSFVGAIVLAAGALQLAVVSWRYVDQGGVSTWLPAGLAAICLFLALRLLRRGRRLSTALGADR